jgi:CARDB protein
VLVALTVAAAALAGPPDLVVTTVEAAVVPVEPGGKLSVPAVVRNVGGRKAAASSTRFLLSEDRDRSADDIPLDAPVQIRALRAGRRAVFVASVRVPAATRVGTYRVLGCADAGRRVKERSERNNCGASSGRVTVRRLLPPWPF